MRFWVIVDATLWQCGSRCLSHTTCLPTPTIADCFGENGVCRNVLLLAPATVYSPQLALPRA